MLRDLGIGPGMSQNSSTWLLWLAWLSVPTALSGLLLSRRKVV